MRIFRWAILFAVSGCGSSTPPAVATAPSPPQVANGEGAASAQGGTAQQAPQAPTAPAPGASSSPSPTPEQQARLAAQAEAMQLEALAVVDGKLTTVSVGRPPQLPASPSASAARPPSPESKAEVQVGGTTATTPVPNADRVVAGLRPRFRACYKRALDDDPTVTGKVILSAKIDANGGVLSSVVAANTGLTPGGAACMAAVLKRATFDAIGGAGSTLSVPITCVVGK